MLALYRSDIVEDKIKLHRSKRNELRQRVTYNKWRLGEFSSLKGGSEHWVDGVDIKDCKEKIESLKKEK